MADPDLFSPSNSSLAINTTLASTLLNDMSNTSSDFTSHLYDLMTENSTVEFAEQTQTQSTTAGYAANSTSFSYSLQNLTKAIDANVNSTQSSILNLTTKATTCTTTEAPFDDFAPPEGVQYIFVPLGVMVFVIILSAVVLIISRKRKLERLRHRLMPLYNFDPGEEGEDDWETELLDENFDSRQKRQGYQSMDTEENAELFSGR